MNKKLNEKTKEWMGLERATFEQRAKAENYYENQLMDLIVKEFIKNNKNKITEQVDYMILSVGTSYEPLVLNLSLFQPKKILFLYTERSEQIIDKIVDFCGLNISDFQKEKVNETNPLDIYKKVKNAYLLWENPAKLYIDFTGGTKAMSAAASMAGAVIDIQLIYVGTNDYLVDFRKPRPGSETLYYISNPYEVFGDFEIEKALHLFEQYNYAGAREKLVILKEKVPDPVIRQQLDFVYYLAGMYEYWDSLDFSKAYHASEYLIHMLERDQKYNPQYILMDTLPILKEQEKLLLPLSEIREQIKEKGTMEVFGNVKFIVPLMFTMLQNSYIREEQEKYDSATLLLYRLLEMIEQRRLSLYGIDVSKADFLEIKYPVRRFPELKGKRKEDCLEWYTKEISAMKQKIFGKPAGKYMSEQISLLDGYIHLAVLQDEIMGGKGQDSIGMLKRLRSAVYLRNNSIFAHGLSPVSTIDYQKFKDYVIMLFQKFCNIEKIDYIAYRKKIEFIDPAKSKYNSIGVKQSKESQTKNKDEEE